MSKSKTTIFLLVISITWLSIIWYIHFKSKPNNVKQKQSDRVLIEDIYDYGGIRIITLDSHQYIEFDNGVIHKEDCIYCIRKQKQFN